MVLFNAKPILVEDNTLPLTPKDTHTHHPLKSLKDKSIFNVCDNILLIFFKINSTSPATPNQLSHHYPQPIYHINTRPTPHQHPTNIATHPLTLRPKSTQINFTITPPTPPFTNRLTNPSNKLPDVAKFV